MGSGVIHDILVVAVAAAAGLGLGAVRVRGVGLGAAGVMFAGLALGHFGVRLDERVLEFVREFGLVLFVFTIGMQVGPGFFSSLKRHGLALNLLAVAVVVAGTALAVLVHVGGGVPLGATVGILAGATTNTPSLAAGTQALVELAGADAAQAAHVRVEPGLGYAVAYPFGVLGVIGAMLALRAAFRIRVDDERTELDRSMEGAPPPLGRRSLEVTNPNLAGLALERVPNLAGSGIAVSRVYRGGALEVARPDTRLELGDVLLAVGTPAALDDLRVVVGRESAVDLAALPGPLTSRRLIVTRAAASGWTLADVDAPRRFGVQITRIGRAEMELPAQPGLELQYGDSVLAVGEPADIARLAAELGDSPRDLNYPHLVPLFLGIGLGVLAGIWPFTLPGTPVPLRLGLAGGPLLVALVLSRLGRLGPLVWYMPTSANYMLREVGLVLFLAAVGLRAGDRFVETLVHGPGLAWMGWGAAITLVPALGMAAAARALLRTNYLVLCGVLAGSMTDPPALSFATGLNRSEAPALAYVTVYPLTIILRVVAAQVLVIALAR
jgi:putative transport protein